MPDLPIARPESIGLDPDRLRRLDEAVASWTASGRPPAASWMVGRRGEVVAARPSGVQAPGEALPIREDATFLVASITKPVVVTAAMLLVERGLLTLDDRVASYVPEFAALDKGGVRLHHLMTHTSGLPDMLPDNVALRQAHAPLSRFVAGTCAQPLLFPPGSRVRYQSKGTLMLAEVVSRVAGCPLPEFLDREVFRPLGMTDTALGLADRPDLKARRATLRVEPEMEGTDWGWNSDYWLDLGAPWGGLVSTPADLARLALLFLGRGQFGGVRILSQAAVRAMTANALDAFPELSEEDRRCKPWGLGWRLRWPGVSANFGDLLGPHAFGHWGATGTVLWADPDTEAFGVFLSTAPDGDDGPLLARAVNLMAAALA